MALKVRRELLRFERASAVDFEGARLAILPARTLNSQAACDYPSKRTQQSASLQTSLGFGKAESKARRREQEVCRDDDEQDSRAGIRQGFAWRWSGDYKACGSGSGKLQVLRCTQFSPAHCKEQIQRIVHRTGSNVDVWPANIGPPQAYVAVVSERAVGVLAVAVVLRHAKLRRAPAAYFPAPVCEDPSSVPSEAASCTHAPEVHLESAFGPHRALGMQPERSVAADVGTPPGALLPSTPQAKPTTSRSMQQAELTRFFGSVSRVATPVACSASLDCSASARSTAPSADPRQAAAPYCASGACALAAEAGPSVVGAFTQPGASHLGCSPDAANPAPTPNLCAVQPCLAATRVVRPLAMHGGAANTPMQLASSSTGSASCPLAPAPGPLQAVDAPSDLLREQRTRKRGRIARMRASAVSADARSAEADRRQALQYLSTNCALKKVARGCDGPATWHSASVASRHAAASTAPCHTTAISTPTCSLVLASDGRVVPRRSAVGKPRLRAVFSVRALWVASDFEGQGVSAQLLDVARRECMAGMAASAEEVAWAEWLPGHAALAAEYCGGREKVLLCR